MRYLVFNLVGILCLCYPSGGQTANKAKPLADKEIDRLREVMNIPPETPIRWVPSKGLPDKNSFKVYGLVKLRINEPQQVTQAWAERWNKKNGAKYGSVEAATDISQADLIFLWFIERTEIMGSEFEYNPIVAITSYLIVQKQTGAEIIWKSIRLGLTHKFSDPAEVEFTKRIKARAKALKK